MHIYSKTLYLYAQYAHIQKLCIYGPTCTFIRKPCISVSLLLVAAEIPILEIDKFYMLATLD